MEWIVGFYGKIPARGDFVVSGVPPAVVDVLDGWMRACLAARRAAPEQSREPSWREVPAWYFFATVAEIQLGGIWLPSIDRVGRTFPLVLVTDAGSAGVDWMDQAEAIGITAVTEDLLPDPAGFAAFVADPGGEVAR